MGGTRRNTVVTAKRVGHLRPFESILDPPMSRERTHDPAGQLENRSLRRERGCGLQDGQQGLPHAGEDQKSTTHTEESHHHTGWITKEEPG